jgi:anti-sigma regulatory factor (Ser/Thr protein kinase)/anti-anti-sigma regulatory factor
VFNLTEESQCLKIELGSEMRHVDMVILEARRFLEKCCSCENSLEFNIVLRELLINAVEHGNLGIPERQILVVIVELGGNRFQITVHDEGKGFDHRQLNLIVPDDPRQIRGRGLSLVHDLTREMEFNGQGNMVRVIIHIDTETDFAVVEREGLQIIRPSGDITARVAGKLKELLFGLVARGHTYFRFDFQKVRELDSVGLSIFIVLARTLEEKGRRPHLEIINADQNLRGLLQITRVDAVYRLIQGG